MQSLRRTVSDAGFIVLTGIVVALAANFFRADGLPLVARTPYLTLVPCPEPGGPVEVLDAGSPEVASPKSFLVDARSRSEFDTRHLPGAVNVHYDWLDPLPEASLAELARSIAASGATRVVVYGDGGRPDSGEYLAKEISGRGIKNVHFIRGGAPATLGVQTP
jgi:rhodanese-related sulfurtransferase